MIGISVARVHNSKNVMPDITEYYSTIFADESEEAKQAKQERSDELSALRFKQFAQSFNAKFNKEVANIE